MPKGTAESEIKRAENYRRKKGCEEPAPTPQFEDDETGELCYRCPVALVERESWELLQIYIYIEAGFLPFEESIMKESAYLMNRMRVIRSAIQEYTGDKRRK